MSGDVRWRATQWAGTAVDVAAQRRPGVLRRRMVVAEAVADLSHRALSAHEPDDLLRESLQVALDVLGADYGTAVRRLPDGRLRVAKELGPEPLPPGTILSPAAHQSYIMQVIETGLPMASVDLREDPRITPPESLLSRGVVAGLAVPVRGAEAVTGVLALHFRRRHRVGRDDVAAASALASVVATGWQQAEQREQLSHQALHDPLTGLPNRALFFDRLDQALVRRPPPGRDSEPDRVAIMLIDLDNFKSANDTFGHAAGDQLLRVVAQRLHGAVRPQDTIARLGGDEFGVLCEQIPDESTVISLAQRMGSACAQEVELAGSSVKPSASFGISWGGSTRAAGTRTAANLVAEADAALYRAKDRGQGHIQMFDDRLERSTRRRRQLASELRVGLDREEFELLYQPVRDSTDLHILGLEALVRWNHPSRGQLLPSDFITIAEQTGLIVPLGEWALRTACRQVGIWQSQQEHSADGLWLAVNVSPRQLDDSHLPTAVIDALRDSTLDLDSLVLELTESAVLPGDAAQRDALLRLRNVGVRLFLDDFGTGYSSLTHLTELPIQAVKIDKSFVNGLPESRRSAAVVSALITMSDELGLQVVAEGVENARQLKALQDMRCQAVQGFLLDRPGPLTLTSPLTAEQA